MSEEPTLKNLSEQGFAELKQMVAAEDKERAKANAAKARDANAEENARIKDMTAQQFEKYRRDTYGY